MHTEMQKTIDWWKANTTILAMCPVDMQKWANYYTGLPWQMFFNGEWIPTKKPYFSQTDRAYRLDPKYSDEPSVVRVPIRQYVGRLYLGNSSFLYTDAPAFVEWDDKSVGFKAFEGRDGSEWDRPYRHSAEGKIEYPIAVLFTKQ